MVRSVSVPLPRSSVKKRDTIEDMYEPFLMQIGFLDRTPRGRVATERAYRHFGLVRPSPPKATLLALLLSEFDFELPPELIAQEPLERRDESRLLHLVLPSGALRHSRILELPSILRPADLLVINNTRVFPAKLHGRTESGGLVELLLLQAGENNVWQVLARPAKKLRVGTRIVFGKGELRAIVADVLELGKRNIELVHEGDLYDVLERVGEAPLPPYIKRQSAGLNGRDRERYQTVYARARGSVAAPTAGLHFTHELLRSLVKREIATAELTLHVGYGTFQPIPRRSHREPSHRT